MKNLTEFLQRAMNSYFYSARLAAEQAGDFFVLQFLEAAENEHFALVFGQLH